MAISQVQPLLLILLASLFFLPVLCAIKFEYCNNNIGYEFGNVSSVAIKSKGEDTTIFVYGKANANNGKSLEAGGITVNLGESKADDDDNYVYSLNEVADTVPIKAGSNFALTLTQVPLQDDKVSYYKFTVTLYDEDEDEDEEYTQTGESFRKNIVHQLQSP